MTNASKEALTIGLLVVQRGCPQTTTIQLQYHCMRLRGMRRRRRWGDQKGVITLKSSLGSLAFQGPREGRDCLRGV